MSRRRWPLVIIGASAGAATWSGWVGLGALTGFGVIRPLPGIWDGLQVNTAITLPIGVEAYAVYALSVATEPSGVGDRARRWAWGSAAGGLGLGLVGQVSYHLLTSAGVKSAPWWVTAIVACVPVLVVGAASLLWHLAGQAEPKPATLNSELEVQPEPAPLRVAAAEQPRARVTEPTDPAPAGRSDAELLADVRAAITAGRLDPEPSGAKVRALLGVGADRAKRILSMIGSEHDG